VYAERANDDWSGDGNIFTITLDEADKTYLTFDGHPDSIQNGMASWSSDGSKIVYSNTKLTDPPASGGLLRPTGQIWTMNADGSDQKELTFGPIYGSLPSFSPDGKSILFTGFATANPAQWLMNSVGEDPRPITYTTDWCAWTHAYTFEDIHHLMDACLRSPPAKRWLKQLWASGP
jgi:Tol biopolymer transport system component